MSISFSSISATAPASF